MKVTLEVGNGVVREASYETYQCPACHECGKALCSMIRGKPLEAAVAVTWQELAERVGPLPRPKRICYSLAVLALDDALKHLTS
jgi:NifU-like protein involved in Fe-S cluster formation